MGTLLPVKGVVDVPCAGGTEDDAAGVVVTELVVVVVAKNWRVDHVVLVVVETTLWTVLVFRFLASAEEVTPGQAMERNSVAKTSERIAAGERKGICEVR